MPELLDILDEKGKLTGKSATKKELHEKGLWHQSAHIWIYNSKGQVLLQKRATIKDSYAGLWDVSAAGHISAGEKPEKSAAREVFEEIGLKIKEFELKKAGIVKVSEYISDAKWTNNEFDHIFLLKYDGDLKKLKLQKEEVDEIKFFSLTDLKNEIENPKTYKKYVPHGKYYFNVIDLIKKELRR